MIEVTYSARPGHSSGARQRARSNLRRIRDRYNAGSLTIDRKPRRRKIRRPREEKLKPLCPSPYCVKVSDVEGGRKYKVFTITRDYVGLAVIYPDEMRMEGETRMVKSALQDYGIPIPEGNNESCLPLANSILV